MFFLYKSLVKRTLFWYNKSIGGTLMHTLTLKNLTVQIEGKLVLDQFSLTIKTGEIHAIMGPNGAGKSTLSRVIMGDSRYEILSGELYFDDQNLRELSTFERARLGLFLGMQMPEEIPGLSNADFLRNAIHEKEGNQFKLMPFIKELNETCERLKMKPDMIHRGVNVGFSGGERKKNEILQMYLLKPSMVLLDEIDSGLDVDSLRLVGESTMDYFQKKNPGILVITHYQRLLDYIQPDFVHIMMHGKIIKSGSNELVKEIEENGYEQLLEGMDLHESNSD